MAIWSKKCDVVSFYGLWDPVLIKRFHHLHFSNSTGSNTWRLTIILSCISST